MALHRPDKPKVLAINIVLAITFIGSLALVVWQRVTAARIDDLIERAFEARGAGDTAAFEGYRQSASLLLQLGGVDKVPDPQSDGCDKDEAEEAVGGFVVSGRQSSAVFEL